MQSVVLLSLIAFASAAVYGGEQTPKVWSALRILRGGKDITTEEQQDLIANAVAGRDYPDNKVVPNTLDAFDCSKKAQAGFYADFSKESRCQVFHRCDVNGQLTSYVCPSLSVFNQITLVCDWFFNVDCTRDQVLSFENYSNSRLYQETAKLLDDQLVL